MNKKRTITIIVLLIIITAALTGAFFLYQKNQAKKREQLKIQQETKLNNIKSKYSSYIKTTKPQNIYEKTDKTYKKVGKVEKDIILELEQTNIDINTKYFKIKDSDYYIEYNNLKKEQTNSKDNRYKRYLPFNENVITKNEVKLYKENTLAFTLKSQLNKKIIEKSNEGYYIEFLNELFLIKKEDVQEIKQEQNTTEEEATKIPVTVYHFIYLNGDESCNEIICHSENQINEHFNYLKEENYFTVTTNELYKFIESNIRLPKKSILVTIDDGARAQNFIPFLEKYQINATLFLITSWYDKENFQSPYMEIASHTNDLHKPGLCSGGQGSPLKCLSTEELVKDLTESRNKLNQTEVFCFPFYEFNNHAIDAVKQAGFKMAFIGGGAKVTKNTDKYKIPRITLSNSTTLEEYKKIIMP